MGYDMRMTVRRVRTPTGGGWFSFCVGEKVPRRAIWKILLGRYQARIINWQSNDPHSWDK